MSAQAREPQGTPSGGQFASTGTAEANVELVMGERGGGSFYFPTAKVTAQSFADFWMNVEMPEEVPQRLSDEQDRLWGVELNERMSAWSELNPPPEKKQRKYDEKLADWQQARKIHQDEVVAAMAKHVIHVHDLRPMARIIQMNRYKFWLPPQERKVFDQKIFHLSHTAVARVDQLVEHFGLERYQEVVSKKPKPDEESLGELRALRDQIGTGLRQVHDQINKHRIEDDERYWNAR